MSWIDETLSRKASEFRDRQETRERVELVEEMQKLRSAVTTWAEFMFSNGFDGREVLWMYVQVCFRRNQHPSRLSALWIKRAWKAWQGSDS